MYVIIYLFQGNRREKQKACCRESGRKEDVIMKKYCTKCGHEFEATGREVICPACKAQAAEDAKRAAVLKAKLASWNGESVPVRISGRASMVIREYGKANNLPFAQALDDLLKASSFFQTMGKAWEEVEPYKSHRRDKHATENVQDGKQEVTSKPQDAPQEVKTAQAAKKAASKVVKTAAEKKVKA